MLSVTDSAKQELDAFFAGKDKATVRIYMASGGWSGPRLALALDEPRDGDKTVEAQGYTFCIESELAEKAGEITVDAGYMGFVIQSANPLGSGSGCSSCGGSCS